MKRLLALAAVFFLVRWSELTSARWSEHIDMGHGSTWCEESRRFGRMPQEIKLRNIKSAEALWNSLTLEDRVALNLTITRVEENTTRRETNFIPKGVK